ncbi:MAG: hypothetical protein NDI61_05495 [Bdellovibrionaceae bacterium]|nr:hypothetical protein [Pseudobdellovibrionaceae bacterium]
MMSSNPQNSIDLARSLNTKLGIFIMTAAMTILPSVVISALRVASVSAQQPKALPPPPTSFQAKIYDKSDRSTPLYIYKHESKFEGDKRTIKNVFTTPAGEAVVVENAELLGPKVIRYQQQQKQVGSDGQVEAQGDQLVFTLTKGGQTATAKEKLQENLAVGPSLIPYLHAHWGELVAGKPVEIRFGVIDRKETVGFTLKKERDLTHNGRPAIAVKMKPTSFLIAALVDPLHFVLDAENGLVLELTGRVLPKKQVSGKWTDLDAVTVYEYQQ